MPSKSRPARTGWVAVVGLAYPGPGGREKRVEAGGRCDDVPESSIPRLVETGRIRPAQEPADGGSDDEGSAA